MQPQGKAIRSFSRIINLLRDLSSTDKLDVIPSKYPSFPTFASHIAKLFSDDRLFDIIPRLEIELGIIAKHNPPVRPAMDPYVSTQIGIFSKNYSDWEIGGFLGYPDCCMRPFADEARYGIDERHAAELKKVKGRIFVATAGFIPHSIFCSASQAGGLIAFVTKEELESIRQVERELTAALPHFHSEYQGQYYEVRVS
ncbi:MAG: DUF483 domain-containing protein [Candidatus Methanomethylicaceae archaeon]|jgi:hypothetical protein